MVRGPDYIVWLEKDFLSRKLTIELCGIKYRCSLKPHRLHISHRRCSSVNDLIKNELDLCEQQKEG